jgi:hypothetical protein
MNVHFCVEGSYEIFHRQAFEDISPLLKMKEAGTLIKFTNESEDNCRIEGRIIKTSFETVLHSNQDIKEQVLVVHLFVENEEMRERLIGSGRQEKRVNDERLAD